MEPVFQQWGSPCRRQGEPAAGVQRVVLVAQAKQGVHPGLAEGVRRLPAQAGTVRDAGGRLGPARGQRGNDRGAQIGARDTWIVVGRVVDDAQPIFRDVVEQGACAAGRARGATTCPRPERASFAHAGEAFRTGAAQQFQTGRFPPGRRDDGPAPAARPAGAMPRTRRTARDAPPLRYLRLVSGRPPRGSPRRALPAIRRTGGNAGPTRRFPRAVRDRRGGRAAPGGVSGWRARAAARWNRGRRCRRRRAVESSASCSERSR